MHVISSWKLIAPKYRLFTDTNVFSSNYLGSTKRGMHHYVGLWRQILIEIAHLREWIISSSCSCVRQNCDVSETHISTKKVFLSLPVPICTFPSPTVHNTVSQFIFFVEENTIPQSYTGHCQIKDSNFFPRLSSSGYYIVNKTLCVFQITKFWKLSNKLLLSEDFTAIWFDLFP